jgi:hypothetical protein
MSTDVLLKSMTRKYYGKSLMLGANARLAEWLNVAELGSSPILFGRPLSGNSTAPPPPH